MVLSGWHTGEKAIQTKLGYARAMEIQQGYKWTSDYMPPQHRSFHSNKVAFVPLTTLDEQGRPWVSFLSGDKGFVTSPSDTALRIRASVIPGDPILHNVKLDDGLIAGLGIELATRRRNKFGGKIISAKTQESRVDMTLLVDQALGYVMVSPY